MKIYFISLMMLALTACSSSPMRGTAQTLEVKYYFGDVAMSSADGKIPYGKTISLVKRTVDPVKATIVEVVLQPPRNPQQKPKDIVTTLTQQDGGNVFLAADEDRSFTGKMVFEGSAWSWNTWTYDIKLVDGSKITGTGKLDTEGIKTQKTFFKADGVASVLLKEDLKSISAEEYEKQRQKMLSTK